ncbi:glyoxalase [Phaeodactylibacter luteus]|uniref:Glyoxalase n=1 Tax=Phaeodactylibacter luteus TaxID=1564516 RepID=A0A5C6RJY6_9BACT|nr:glyoxalase [Phaeodactylibacter luteus]TXB61642.1 glyoxalase [Phaeodactylibacter luteus]
MTPSRTSIRPKVATAGTATSIAEQFQNETLRPVLKMQHELLSAVFLHMMDKRKVPFSGMKPEDKARQIAHSVSKDKRLRFQLLGLVIGQFTLEEYQTFLGVEGEAVRRIAAMIVQRLQDALI